MLFVLFGYIDLNCFAFGFFKLILLYKCVLIEVLTLEFSVGVCC